MCPQFNNICNFSISLLKDLTSTTAEHDGSQKKKEIHILSMRILTRVTAVAQNGENGNTIVVNISEHLQLERFATKYLRLVF